MRRHLTGINGGFAGLNCYGQRRRIRRWRFLIASCKFRYCLLSFFVVSCGIGELQLFGVSSMVGPKRQSPATHLLVATCTTKTQTQNPANTKQSPRSCATQIPPTTTIKQKTKHPEKTAFIKQRPKTPIKPLCKGLKFICPFWILHKSDIKQHSTMKRRLMVWHT